ncbi:MAG: SDR family oxidoreductase [Pseudomonadales bacterium]|jgi:NAD(P)-dependent dehydrogenase (short-subunit alcohol dehydrogenase family)|nr:SDR family oxidoreductase [Gammaproteobacteria bacterium]
MNIQLTNRTALVTGGSLGLGYAMAEAFARAGANVAIVARRENVLQEALDRLSATDAKVAAYSCDVADAGAINSLWDQVMSEFGRVDILVNNAGRSQAGPFEEITDEIWQMDLDLKLFAAIRLARLALPGMKERRWGRIINILNLAARAPGPGSAPTSVSRAAGLALTKVLAGECAPHNVLVNALMIGRIKSDQILRAYENASTEQSFEEFVETQGKRLPMGRMGEASECANLALFLSSDNASYINGCAINMDGGLSQVP